MAEIDIVPELLAQIQQDFNQAYKNDTKIQQLADKISSGKADYADAQEFAQRTGELMTAALQKNITADKLPNGQMYYNIADRILGTMLKTDYGIVAKKAAEVQQHLNENAGLGLKAQTADYDEENAKSIIDKVSASEDFNTVSYMLKAPVETFSMKVVDDTIKKNADFHYKAGLKPRIVRSAETKCCDWCASLDGTYEYPGVPKEVFARHNNCRCTVNYDPRDGKVQNVWNKKEWKDAEEYDKIETRKSITPEGNNTLSNTNKALSILTEEQLGAIIKYKGPDSYVLNDLLRDNDTIDSLEAKYQVWINNLDAALKKMPKYEGDLLRVVDFAAYPDAEERTNDFLREHAVGNKINYKQYLSASLNPNYNDEASIQIFIEHSQNGRNISNVGIQEGEVLYERNSGFMVTAQMKVNNKWYIILEEQ